MAVLIQKFRLYPTIFGPDTVKGTWVCLKQTLEETIEALDLVKFEPPKLKPIPKGMTDFEATLLTKIYLNFYISANLSTAEVEDRFSAGKLEAFVLSEVPIAGTFEDLQGISSTRLKEIYTDCYPDLAGRIRQLVRNRSTVPV